MPAAHSLEPATHAQKVLLEVDLIQLNVYAQLVKHMMLPEDLVNVMMRSISLNQMQAIHSLELATHVLMVLLEVHPMLLSVNALLVNHTTLQRDHALVTIQQEIANLKETHHSLAFHAQLTKQ